MKIIKPHVEIWNPNSRENAILKLSDIEWAGRICYKSEEKITPESYKTFIKSLIKRGHESVIEHGSATVKIICDRGVSHEIVRHRIASYSQESTRYCNYSQDKFENELTFIKPCFTELNSEQYLLWESTCRLIENNYFILIQEGWKPEEARSILPNSLKTELVMTANFREWRHFLKLRTHNASHPQMREVANLILNEFNKILPEIFEDINL